MRRGNGSPGQKTPEEVVSAALRALEAGDDYVVPGALNRVGAALSRLAPLGLVTRIAGQVIRRIG
jgi:short-subunit dehydrogenase